MKKPENFRKIDNTTFASRTGTKYKFSTDGISPELWVFTIPDDTEYVLAFIIDWENETYQIKRAGNGKGNNWIDTIHSGNFTSQPMKTINSFIDWAYNRLIQFEHYYNKL
jgi:hypothetical protein